MHECRRPMSDQLHFGLTVVTIGRHMRPQPSSDDSSRGSPLLHERAMEPRLHCRRPKDSTMKKMLLLFVFSSFLGVSAFAQEAKVTPLMSKDFKEFAGKEGVLIRVEYPPGATDPIHRHNAEAFVYVLEGRVVMQVKGGKQVTLGPGQTFYEGPNDIHVVGKNASSTQPATFLVFLVKDKNAPIVIPVK